MTDLQPIRARTVVRLDTASAFELFIERIDTWWPTGPHAHGEGSSDGVTTDRIEIEPFLGGFLREQMSNGQTLGGEIVVWEPPTRFVVGWRTGRSESPPTEVEVRFTAQTDGGTVVELEHRGWERLGDVAAMTRPDYATGWIGALERFVEAADRQAA